MAEFYRFFDSTIDDPRKYDADEFAEYFRQILTDGIFNGGTNLQVTCDNSNMKVKANEGYGWIKGYLYKVDIEGMDLLLDNADVTNDRIDRIVLRWDEVNRYIKAFVLKGVPAASPIAPSLTRNDDIYEISLAQVRVIAGKSFISNTEITDERLDTNVCGLVNSLVQVDTTAMQQAFDSFMEEIQGQSPASQSEVDNLSMLMTEFTNISYQLLDKDVNDVYTKLEEYRSDGTLLIRTVFSNPDGNGRYQTETQTKYDINGITILKITGYNITMDDTFKVISRSEVLV